MHNESRGSRADEMERIAGDQREGRNRPRLKNRNVFGTYDLHLVHRIFVRASPRNELQQVALTDVFQRREEAIRVGRYSYIARLARPRRTGYPSGAAVERPMISSFKYRNTETQPLAAQDGQE